MFEKMTFAGDLPAQYTLLSKQLAALLDGETDDIAILSNASALLNQFLDDVNWCGFYLYKEDELLLGPFQGLPACVHIAIGRGVCGTAAKSMETQLVTDVHSFAGHIACDAATNSEIVVPLSKDGALYGVLDIDSPTTGRFTNTDKEGIELFARTLEKFL
ncbi:GAF domain-containing protein [Kurthia huakuii]|uniref:GAF domain-containing protein n=1 Tax=Kurthia huakuii TaxID=1421019 RepID=UPI000494ED03|nr:GAF domain-containing protein [Kurthia huakuii]MBM7697768.1 GAF domain-containing protein [Kurthia huakuii]